MHVTAKLTFSGVDARGTSSVITIFSKTRRLGETGWSLEAEVGNLASTHMEFQTLKSFGP